MRSPLSWRSLIAAGLFAGIVFTGTTEARPHCGDSAKIVGRCFVVHGRLGVYNGIPLRIWVIGTHRMLSVRSADTDNDEDGLPAPVLDLLKQGAPGETLVFGDFDVCPRAKARAGWMRGVCVDGASHLRAVQR